MHNSLASTCIYLSFLISNKQFTIIRFLLDIFLYDKNYVLKLPLETLYKHLRAGKLKGSKLGKHWRISDEQLKEYLKNAEQKPKEN